MYIKNSITEKNIDIVNNYSKIVHDVNYLNALSELKKLYNNSRFFTLIDIYFRKC